MLLSACSGHLRIYFGLRGLLGQTEVEQLCLSAFVDENVGRLDVAVDDMFGMRCIQRIGNLGAQFQHLIDLHRFAHDCLLERLSFHHLHRDERTSLMLADFVDGADVWMVEGRCGLRFALKALQRFGCLDQIVRQEFQRNMPFEAQILRLIHHSHSATTQFIQNAVMRYGLPNHL